MKKTNLQMMFNDNPLVMTGLLKGEIVDVGGGLGIQLTQLSGYTCAGQYIDTLNFHVTLENMSIGDIDHEFGGFIGYDALNYTDERSLEQEDSDFKLFESVTKRMCELFPVYAKERLDLDQNGERISC